jgi:hypothetical protein
LFAVVVGLERFQSRGGLLRDGELAVELGDDGEVFS